MATENTRRSRWLLALAVIGPGVLTAMAGNDAGGISTFSVAGAEFGYATLWLIPIMTLQLAVVQETVSRMGAVTSKGFAALIREKFGLELNVAITGTERRLEPYLEVLIFRSIQDLLTNISQHSQATEAKLHLDMGEREVRVSVGDNGRGFDTQDLGTYAGVGLKLIKERVEMLGGEFTLESSAGQGAQVSFRIPTSATPALE